jgi:hypothetical protein
METHVINTLDRPDAGGHRNMHEQDEIDLTSLDCRALTPDQWALVKRQVVRRAQVERAKAIREMFGCLIFWRGKRAATAPPQPDPTASASLAHASRWHSPA